MMSPLLIALLGATTASAASPCDAGNPATYDATTRPALDVRELEFDCVEDPEDIQKCAPNGVVFPASGIDVAPQLFVWLPGTDGTPANYQHLQNMAGFAGYRSLFLSWDNETTILQKCQGTSGLFGGPCAASNGNDCTRILRDELLSGRDVPTHPVHTPRQLDGLVHRLAMALQREHTEDLADTVNHWHWEQYCSPDPEHGTAIHWENIVLGGHSLGANQAVYVSYRNPTHGVIVAEAGYDTCDVEPFSTPAQAFDPSHPYNNTGQPSLFYTSFTDQSPDARVYFLHETENYPSATYPVLPPSFAHLTPNDINTAGQALGTSAYFVDTANTTWSGQTFVFTDQAPTTECIGPFSFHVSVAADACMPPSAAGGVEVDPVMGDSSTLHLFNPYVEALCGFQP